MPTVQEGASQTRGALTVRFEDARTLPVRLSIRALWFLPRKRQPVAQTTSGTLTSRTTSQFLALPSVTSSSLLRTASFNSSGFLAPNQASAQNTGTKPTLKLRQRMLLKR